MITASIVTFNHSVEQISRLIGALVVSCVDMIYVIDNSNNNTIANVEKISPKIIYRSNQNVGYGRANNIAINEAMNNSAKYHIVINPDIYFNEGNIEKLVDYMDKNSDVGIVMPKILYPNGETQYLCKLLPSPLNLVCRRFIPFRKIVDKLDFEYELRMFDYAHEAEIPSLSGCFMFMRCSTLKESGLFDPRFFMYAEDLDLCRRIGMVSKSVFFPDAEVYHAYEKGSYRGGKLLKYHIVSIVKYFNKWGWFFDSYRRRKNKMTIQQMNNRTYKCK